VNTPDEADADGESTDGEALPSKSRRKREAHAQQALGEALLQIPEAEWPSLAVPEELAAALREALRIHARGGRRRQLQYIGKLMRRIDSEAIAAALARRDERQATARRDFHRLEAWRDRLLAEGDAALPELLAEFPGAERQQLRQLIRNARRERAAAKPPRAARLLFRYLRQLAERDEPSA